MRLPPWLASIGTKAVGLGFAYVFTSLVTIVAIFGLRHQADPRLLQFFLGFLFISSLSSGLDPGTAKSAFMREGADPAAIHSRDIVAASLLKSVVASVGIGLVWRTVDPGASIGQLFWALPVTAAGFLSTDYRVALDWRGRHQQAIWLKQGSLGIGIIVAAGALLAGGSIGAALFWSSAARLGWNGGFIFLAGRSALAWRPATGGLSLADALRRLALDPKWMNIFLMSAVSAVSGTVDRVVVLRFLPPAVSGDYFLWYELVSKFWIIPYVACPIIFARRLRGDQADKVFRGMLALTLAAGAALVAAVPLAIAVVGMRLPHPFNHVDLPVMLFLLGMTLSAVAQLMSADLQGRGRLSYLLFSIIAVMVLTPLIFAGGAIAFGAAGVYAGWLIKSLTEILLYGLPYLQLRLKAKAV